MKKVLFAFGSLFLLITGCVTGDRMGGIREGMSKEDVVSILGNPDGFKHSGNYEAYQYTNRLISGWSWDRADYSIVFKEGRVVEYGPGQVRQNNPSTGVLVIIPVR